MRNAEGAEPGIAGGRRSRAGEAFAQPELAVLDVGAVGETVAVAVYRCHLNRSVFRGRNYFGSADHDFYAAAADGSILWHGFAMEVSDRKRTETTLRESEDRLMARTMFFVYAISLE